jgi:signal transduction histidine kinase
MGTHTSLSSRILENPALRYGLAVGSAIAAIAICVGLHRFVGNGGCYVLLLLAVAGSGWYCGVGPSVAAVVIGLVAATFDFTPHIHSFAAPTTEEWILMLTFLVSSILVIFMGELRRHENERLLTMQTELEIKVQERTADLDTVNRNLRELSARLMQLQDDERRRIARELHDSVGQTLAALAMNLSVVRSDVERLSAIAVALNDSENLIRDMSSEVRTISHLLHPPLLDEAGLASALRWYVDGFAQRSKIKVDLDMPEDFGRLPSDMETAIFRVVQECLTNIHRHSESPWAKIRLRQRHDQVLVEIEDKGKGIPPEKREELTATGTPGVGIRGMRERLRQLGGTLEINSSGNGTTVVVKLPIPDKTGSEKVHVVDGAAA